MGRPRRSRTSSVLAPLEIYLREINETPLLTAAEEKELARRIQEGDSQARDHLVRANLRLVVNIARSFVGMGLGLPDLIEEGNLGLLRAVEGFDAERNTRFSTYASYWIKQCIKRALVNTAKTIRIPAYMVELLGKWRRAEAELHDELGRPGSEREIAGRLGLTDKQTAMVEMALRICAPAAGDEETGLPVDEAIADVRAKAPDLALIDREDFARFAEVLAKMDKRQALVLRLRFGLDGERPKTLKDIGKRLGICRERVRQIEAAALERFRE